MPLHLNFSTIYLGHHTIGFLLHNFLKLHSFPFRAIPFEKLVGGVWCRLFGPLRSYFFVFLGVPRSDIGKNLRPPHDNFRMASQTTLQFHFSRGTLQ